jgi:hypothetical protein
MTWEFLVPNLPVRDVGAAQHWYADVLDFGVNWLGEADGHLLRIGQSVGDIAEAREFSTPERGAM